MYETHSRLYVLLQIPTSGFEGNRRAVAPTPPNSDRWLYIMALMVVDMDSSILRLELFSLIRFRLVSAQDLLPFTGAHNNKRYAAAGATVVLAQFQSAPVLADH